MKKLSLLLPFLALLIACQPGGKKGQQPENLVSLQGRTMGTTLSVKYIDTAQREYAKAIDSLLLVINNSMSTYIPNSTISIFNKMDSAGRMEIDRHFFRVLNKSKAIYEQTNGAFNPAVMPLVKYWGFADEDPPEKVDSSKVDSLLQITNFDKIDGVMVVNEKNDTSYYIRKAAPHLQLDFSAIAKGYGVDAVGKLLESKGIYNYMVEIGGEVRCRGNYVENNSWKIGIEDPASSTTDQRKSSRIVALKDRSIATSGNYRNVREIDGEKYAHSLNPITGYPEHNALLSVSVVADDCMAADGYATACMVMGVEQAKQLFVQEEKLEGFLIIGGDKEEMETFFTPGFEQMLIKQ